MLDPMRYFIDFDPAYRWLSTALFLQPSDSYLEMGDSEVQVRMGWAFRARFRVTAMARVAGKELNRTDRSTSKAETCRPCSSRHATWAHTSLACTAPP
jgi:hypothetical protein